MLIYPNKSNCLLSKLRSVIRKKSFPKVKKKKNQKTRLGITIFEILLQMKEKQIT